MGSLCAHLDATHKYATIYLNRYGIFYSVVEFSMHAVRLPQIIMTEYEHIIVI